MLVDDAVSISWKCSAEEGAVGEPLLMKRRNRWALLSFSLIDFIGSGSWTNKSDGFTRLYPLPLYRYIDKGIN